MSISPSSSEPRFSRHTQRATESLTIGGTAEPRSAPNTLTARPVQRVAPLEPRFRLRAPRRVSRSRRLGALRHSAEWKALIGFPNRTLDSDDVSGRNRVDLRAVQRDTTSRNPCVPSIGTVRPESPLRQTVAAGVRSRSARPPSARNLDPSSHVPRGDHANAPADPEMRSYRGQNAHPNRRPRRRFPYLSSLNQRCRRRRAPSVRLAWSIVLHGLRVV